jgi:GT2 family glycosyltransferase
MPAKSRARGVPMRASVVIAAHNEGDRLWRTVQSIRETTVGLGIEIVVADDASSDDSLAQLRQRFPRVRVVSHPKRLGCSPTKDLGARRSRGDVIVFLDGHCKPEPGAIERLVSDVEDLDGKAILMPVVPVLDEEQWTNSPTTFGTGFWLRLEDFACGWADFRSLRPHGTFMESPSLVGCCFAISRKLYLRLRGFDRHMRQWGVEDIDLGLKAWLLGHSTLLTRSWIGHRFRKTFDNYPVDDSEPVVSAMRMARKNFSEPAWITWLERSRERYPETTWNKAFLGFKRRQDSVERERDYILRARVRDEFDYAERFGLSWPIRVPEKQAIGAGG